MNALELLRRGGIVALLSGAVACAAEAGWIHAKAQLAQVLLSQAWEDGEHGRAAVKPWPWADTHPVARLRAPGQQVDQIVLAGDSGRVLAFGPGWAPASATPGSRGTTVLSGHRDTHFAWLRDLRPGDTVELESAAGRQRWQVLGGTVADSRRERLQLDSEGERLLLVTCWPFDASSPRGPLRYVVTLVPEQGSPPATRT